MKNKIQTVLDKSDPHLVENYMRMFERILLYQVATAMLPQEAIESTVDLWDKVVKKTIDIDVSRRTEYLEGTIPGRLSRLKEEPDGEDLRNHCLEQQKIARDVIKSNLIKPDPWDIDNEEAEA